MTRHDIQLFQSRDGALPDFYLYVGDKHLFQIQRDRVAEASAVLRGILYDTVGSDRSASVKDISAEALKALISYTYEEEIHIRSAAELETLLEAAKQYQFYSFVTHIETVKANNQYPTTIKRSAFQKRGYHLVRLSDLEKEAIKERTKNPVVIPLKKLEDLPDIENIPPSQLQAKPPKAEAKPKIVTDLRDELKKRSDGCKKTHETMRTKRSGKLKKIVKQEEQYTVSNTSVEPNPDRQKIYEEYAKKNEIPDQLRNYYRDKYLDGDAEDKAELKKHKPSPSMQKVENVVLRPKPPQPNENRKSWIERQTDKLNKRMSDTSLVTENTKKPELKKQVSQDGTAKNSISDVLAGVSKTLEDNPKVQEMLLTKKREETQAAAAPKKVEETKKVAEPTRQTLQPQSSTENIIGTIPIRTVVKTTEKMNENSSVRDRLLVMNKANVRGVGIRVVSTLAPMSISLDVLDSNKTKIAGGVFMGNTATGEIIFCWEPITVQKADFLYFSFTFNSTAEYMVFGKGEEPKFNLVPVRGSDGIIEKVMTV